MAREAVIVEAVRTAIGKRNGSLAQAHAADRRHRQRDARRAGLTADPAASLGDEARPFTQEPQDFRLPMAIPEKFGGF